MIIYFGTALDDVSYPATAQTTGGMDRLGPQGLLRLLESHLGLTGRPDDQEYLRIEHYRQALSRYLSDYPEAFFASSFAADQFATATDLLARRDELLLAGWDFRTDPDVPERLRCLSSIEDRLTDNGALPAGFADRLQEVVRQLPRRRQPLQSIFLADPPDLLPPHLRRLLAALAEQGVTIEALPAPTPGNHSDLGHFQQAVSRGGLRGIPARGDGSLLLIRAQRETHLAGFLARLCRLNPGFQPVCLVPEKNRTLDLALTREGLPSMGIPSASLARPTLQVLKLITVFLWEPINPFKIMEFVSLAVKPLEDELANRIAEHMAQTPGLQSNSWYFMIHQFFEEVQEQAGGNRRLNPRRIREQYNFWFERDRYDSSGKAPKAEVIGLFHYLRQWAAETFEENNGDNQSLLVLSEQARRITELLEALPETELTNLELERIVRTIYEPAPVQFTEERGHLSYLHRPDAFTGAARELVWWNFVQNEQEHFFSRWYQPEIRWLEKRGLLLSGPREENDRLIRQRKQPILQTRDRLILFLPEMVEGSETTPHPLYGDLAATFGDLSPITCDLDTETGLQRLTSFFTLPGSVNIQPRRLGRPRPFLRIRPSHLLQDREEETFSSLESLFYYPYQWVFRHKIRLRKSSILSLVKDHTLMGNLAHRFFELLFRQDTRHWTQEELSNWIDQQAANLLPREGSVLLMYGREPERVNFIKRIKFSAWSLLHLLRSNGWEVEAAELPIEGDFLGIPVRARADLVLTKGDERAVLDLKWRGARRRENAIRNEEDLQLVLYSHLLDSGHSWAHTAFFIMENGRLIARNDQAFREVNPVTPDSDHAEVNERILQRMHATYHWRMEQIRRGEIEVRCNHTFPELEEHYGQVSLDILEMRNDDAPFDDYRTLINLIV